MQKPITPVLMFSGDQHGKAEEAITFYTATFPNSRITSIVKYGPDQSPEPEGTVQTATFELNGTPYLAMDSAQPHPFNFTPSVSFFVTAADDAEFDTLFTALADGGQTLMAPDNYGFSRKFAWLNDRYGVSWQINCE